MQSFKEEVVAGSGKESDRGSRSSRPGTADVRMSTLKMKRLMTVDSGTVNIALVDGEADVDLNFVVHGDFFDGEEFHPHIMTEEEKAHFAEMRSEAEEINVDFGDERGSNFAVPIDDDETMAAASKNQGKRQTVSTFDYAKD